MTERPPSVDRLARQLAAEGSPLPHALLVDAARAAIAAGDVGSAAAVARRTERLFLRRVVNATGVLLHTNLGRAPASGGAMNVELDLTSGTRGGRAPGVALLVRLLTGAEDAIVVNNGAAAALLALTAVAAGREVVISRGELVEIGGGFRIPDILEQSGARLVEVGTTNITRVGDYQRVLGPDGVVLVVHQSNFAQTGFVGRPRLAELAALGAPLVVDLGSGLLDAATPWLPGGPPAWLHDEPAARQALADGATVVTFSGDKLLGGPQAGIIAGRADVVEQCRRHPLARALRPGGLVLGALERALLAHVAGDVEALPFWRMATAAEADLRRRAEVVAAESRADVVDCESAIGGGSVPGVTLPSAGVAVVGDALALLRDADPPIVARVVGGRTVCDLRTVDPADDNHLAAVLKSR
ncbi:MAG: selA [Acidimicrobiales bacterium]|nr:selA [Acidimicrobiales bacterium]